MKRFNITATAVTSLSCKDEHGTSGFHYTILQLEVALLAIQQKSQTLSYMHSDECRPSSQLQKAWPEAELLQPQKFHRPMHQRAQQRFVSLLDPGAVKIQTAPEEAGILHASSEF